MGSDPAFETSQMPTGVLPIDVMTGGGLPRNRFTVITGDFSTLKSYIGLSAIAQVQAAGGVAALIDTEHAFDPQWAKSIGVNVDDLILPPTETGEEALDAGELLIRQQVDLLVVDSVAATQPQSHALKRLHGENIQPARQAALMSEACRRLTSVNSKTALLWINQLREDIGGMSFGPREKATGGRALPYYASFIIRMKKVGKITEERKSWDGEKFATSKVVVAQKFKAELEKSKLSEPFREEWFLWNLRSGFIDEAAYLIGQGLEHGLVKKNGNTWTGGGVKAVGKDKFRDAVEANPDGLRMALLPVILPNAVGLKKPKTKVQPGSRALPKKKGLRKRRES